MKNTIAELKKSQRVAIVTTLKNVGPMLDSFITYHLSVGFEHIFLFFDDPDDPSIPVAQMFSKVTAIRHDEELREKWRHTNSYRIFGNIREYLDMEVMSRQVLNVEVALQLSREKGIDWLLHIDSDELFYSPGKSAGEHFQAMTDQGLHRVVYPNHEGIPESCDIEDPFKEVTLFKKNTYALAGRTMSAQQDELIKSFPQMEKKYFLFYSNGKSATRVSEDVLPIGVHGFKFIQEHYWLPRLHRKLTSGKRWKSFRSMLPVVAKGVDNFFLRLTKIKHKISDEASILHFPCCGFESFWNKYVTLGSFSDQWFGTAEISQRIGSFHLEARDVVMRGNRKAAREFYKNRVVINNEADINRLVDGEVCCRIFAPSDLIAAEDAKDFVRPTSIDNNLLSKSALKRRRIALSGERVA